MVDAATIGGHKFTMSHTIAIMVTLTTYGTWLRGDRRGWIDDGKLMPPQPRLEAADVLRMKHPTFCFDPDDLRDVGRWMGESLIARKQVQLLAMCVNVWHTHFVLGATSHDVADIVKCAKDAVRYGLRPGRPIWTDGYDKRFCFDEASVLARIRYVERHNEAMGWAAKPWGFLVGASEARSTPNSAISPQSMTGG
jgi:REP element-mobilizing transposase RayT